MELVTIFYFLPHCGDVDDFFSGLVKCVRRRTPLRETTVSRSQVPPASRDNHLICIQEDNGEAESAKSEMMVASSMLL